MSVSNLSQVLSLCDLRQKSHTAVPAFDVCVTALCNRDPNILLTEDGSSTFVRNRDCTMSQFVSSQHQFSMKSSSTALRSSQFDLSVPNDILPFRSVLGFLSPSFNQFSDPCRRLPTILVLVVNFPSSV